MKASTFYDAVRDLGLGRMARAVGCGFQTSCYSADSFVRAVASHNGKGPVWTSQNAFEPDNTGGPVAIILDNFFIELEGDGKTKLEQQKSHVDMLKVVEFCKTHGWEFIVCHSGNKSFHARIRLNGEKYDWRHMQELNRIYGDVTNSLIYKLELKTVDRHCAEPKRLLRVPFTVGGVSPNGNKRFCVPIPVSMLTDLDAILELAEHPKLYSKDQYSIKGVMPSLDKVVESAGRRWVHMGDEEIQHIGLNPYAIPDDDFAKFLDLIFAQKCVLSENLKFNPKNDMRVAMIAWLNFLGYSIGEAKALCDKVAEYAKWNDRANTRKRHYHVERVMKGGYQVFGCRKLMQEGVCVGESCPLFEHFKVARGTELII